MHMGEHGNWRSGWRTPAEAQEYVTKWTGAERYERGGTRWKFRYMAE